jgi:hypothetical protein
MSSGICPIDDCQLDLPSGRQPHVTWALLLKSHSCRVVGYADALDILPM